MYLTSTNLTKKILPSTIALAAGLYHGIASADVAEVVTENGEVMTFEYEGDNMRINTPAENAESNYMLLRDSKLYVVTQQDGRAMVFDLGSALSMFGAMAEGATPDAVTTKVVSLEPTNKKETLGGIEGEVYELRYIDQKGNEQSGELVLSDDPLARGFRDAIQDMAMTMTKMLDDKTFEDERKVGEDMQARLESLDKGVLRYGKDMAIRSIKDTTVDAQRFVLPAEPTDLGSMLSGALGGGQAGGESGGNSSGGVLGSIFGGGSEQQAPSSDGDDRQEPESAAGNMGKAVGEAFGKLFGN